MKKPAHEPYDRQTEHRPPPPESFASEAERVAFNKAKLRFTREGKLDPLIAFLRRGEPLSVGVAENLANIFSGTEYSTHTSTDDFLSGFRITVVEKKPAHRPADRSEEKFKRALMAAAEIRQRVEKNHEKFSAARAEVCKKYRIGKLQIDGMLRTLDEVMESGPLPRDRRGRKRRAQ